MRRGLRVWWLEDASWSVLFDGVVLLSLRTRCFFLKGLTGGKNGEKACSVLVLSCWGELQLQILRISVMQEMFEPCTNEHQIQSSWDDFL